MGGGNHKPLDFSFMVDFTYYMHAQFVFFFIQYKQASTTLSVSSIRQQFSTPENIHLSQYSYKFLTEVGQHLGVDWQDAPDIQLQQRGYLITASSSGVQTLLENHRIQK